MEQTKIPYKELSLEEKAYLKEEYANYSKDVCTMCRCHREPITITGKFKGDRYSPPDEHVVCSCCGEEYTPERPSLEEFYEKQA